MTAPKNKSSWVPEVRNTISEAVWYSDLYADKYLKVRLSSVILEFGRFGPLHAKSHQSHPLLIIIYRLKILYLIHCKTQQENHTLAMDSSKVPVKLVKVVRVLGRTGMKCSPTWSKEFAFW
jgi:hypothetical protein